MKTAGYDLTRRFCLPFRSPFLRLIRTDPDSFGLICFETALKRYSH
jgi:hypothetical protein